MISLQDTSPSGIVVRANWWGLLGVKWSTKQVLSTYMYNFIRNVLENIQNIDLE